MPTASWHTDRACSADPDLKLWLYLLRPQIFADGVPRHTKPPRNLPDRHMLTLMPPADDAQKCHVQHSRRPRLVQTGERSNMGQFSVEKSGLAGSGLSGNQHPSRLTT